MDVKKELLKKPSDVLKLAQARTTRDYALLVYKSLLLAFNCPDEKPGQLFVQSFSSHSEAEDCKKNITDRICMSVDLESKSQFDYYFLAPCFLRANKDHIIEVTENFFMILCSSGPVIPIVRQINGISPHNTSSNLLNHVLAAYSALSSSYVTLDNFGQILSKHLT